MCILNKQKNAHFAKAGELLFLFALISSFLFVNTSADSSVGYGTAMKEIFTSAFEQPVVSLTNGGVVGAFLGGAIFQMCKSVALSNVLLAILLICDVMLLFGITLVKLVMQIEKPVRKAEGAIERSKDEMIKSYKEKQQERAAEKTAEKPEKKKSVSKDVNPSRIIKDFFDTNNIDENEIPVSENEAPVKSKKEKTEEVAEPNLFNIAELVSKSKRAEEINIITDEAEDIVPIEEKPAVTPEKLEPLSEKEARELRESLDNAVNTVPEVEYSLPPIDCLNPPKKEALGFNEDELKSNGEKLIAALDSFNVSASIVGVVPGPTVTRYELSPAPGVKISKFTNLADDLALHMAAPSGLRIEAPIPNKAAIGIEIPNRNKTTVTFRESIDNDKFRKTKSKLTVALGKDIAGNPMFSDLAKMPHLLVAGTTGSGKSVCLNSMIVSILYNATPDEVKILLIDPKQVEFGVYNGLPHLLVPVVSDPRKAAGALGWAVTEMLTRYKTLNANGVRDIAAYNSLCDEREDLVKMPQIVIFIDELADLMTVAPSEVEDSIQRLAQMARAAGMHLVVATQRPSVDVITGVIKANIPSRIALTVKSYVDSKIIIDTAGAEKLMGYGDMLYYPVGVPKPVRIQGCYLSDGEIEKVVDYIKGNNATNYSDEVQQEIERQAVQEKKKTDEPAASSGGDGNDDLINRAIELFVSAPEKASISALQRHLGLGFAKAGRLMDTLEQKGIVGPHMGSKPRNVLVTKAQWYEMSAMSSDVTATGGADDDFTEESYGDND
ncbi:MAG: DNA translocase FtsK [Clostridia bacterium]|nr:DNA translocase FtsK [Clostridia bacterium]